MPMMLHLTDSEIQGVYSKRREALGRKYCEDVGLNQKSSQTDGRQD
jgi:hypothetical protein